jgi:hypothetical protein
MCWCASGRDVLDLAPEPKDEACPPSPLLLEPPRRRTQQDAGARLVREFDTNERGTPSPSSEVGPKGLSTRGRRGHDKILGVP